MRRTLIGLLALVWLCGCGKPDGSPTESFSPEVFDPTSFGHRQAPRAADAPPIRIVDVGPEGETGAHWNVGQVHVRFNQPVRAVTGAAEQDAVDWLTVSNEEGPVAGQAYFKAPDLLVFEADRPLAPAHRYDVRLAMSDTRGGAVDIAQGWAFETARPSLSSIDPVDGAQLVSRDAPIYVTTSQRTDVAQLRPRITVAVNGEPVDFDVREATDEELARRWYGAGHTAFRIDADAPFPVDAKVTVRAASGWRSDAGPLQAADDFEGTFRVHPDIEVASIECHPDDGELCAIGPVQVEFSTPLRGDLEEYIAVTPRPAEFSVTALRNEQSTMFWVDGRFLPGIEYRLRVKRGATDVFGQSLARHVDRTLRFEMPPPDLFFNRDRGTIVDDGEPHLGISSRHVEKIRVRAARVSTEKWLELHSKNLLRADRLPPIDSLGDVGERDLTVDLAGPTNWASTPVDLADLVGEWRGPVALSVEAAAMVDGYEPQGLESTSIVQFTSLVPNVITSHGRSLVWVHDLNTDRPASNVRVELHGTSTRVLGETDDDGLVEFGGYSASDLNGDHYVVLHDEETGARSILDFEHHFRGPRSEWMRAGESVRGSVVVERGVYSPGDEVHVVGWAALRTPHDPYGFRSIPHRAPAHVELVDGHGTVLDDVEVTLQHGKFWAQLTVPRSARLGKAVVRARLGDSGESQPLQRPLRIEEFRTPDFEVEARASASRIVGGESVQLDVRANYFSGGPVEIAKLRPKTRCHRVSAPASEPGWQVGIPPWGRHGYGGYGGYGTVVTRTPPKNIAPGHSRVVVKPSVSSEGHTQTCYVTTVVQSDAFQEAGDTATLLVHPADRYIGVRHVDPNPDVGDDVTLQFASFDLDGTPTEAGGSVDVEVTRKTRKPVYTSRGAHRWISSYEEETEVVTTCSVSLGSRPSCRIRNLRAGTYEVVATLADDEFVRTTTQFGVYDGRASSPKSEELVAIEVPDDVVQPGADASVTVRTMRNASGLLLIERYGVRDVIPFRTRHRQASFDLPVDPSWAPEMSVHAYVIDASTDYPRIVDATAKIRVDDAGRRLDVSLEAPKTASIRQTVPVEVRIADASGPVDGRVALWAVDEAVLGLTGYEVPDVVEAFLPRYQQDVFVYDDLASVLPVFTPERHDPFRGGGFGLRGFGSGGGGSGIGMGRMGSAGADEKPRTEFEATPFFLGDAATEDGVAEMEIELPDNMTAFRVIAIASATLHDESTPMRFGTASSLLRVSAPLIARPALPRFVRPGDSFELASVVDDRTAKEGALVVEARIDGEAVAWADGVTPARRIDLDSTPGQHRVGFVARALKPGTVDVEIRAELQPADGSATIVDVVRVPLESRPEPTVTETVAVYGTLDDDRTRSFRIKPPADARDDYGGLSMSVTSTLLGGLRDATRQLIRYPYGCLEQTASRMLPIVALSHLSGFVEPGELPDAATVDQFMADGLKRIVSLQQEDGGFSYWPGTGASNAYGSAYAAWVLHLARRAGHELPAGVFEGALDYLETQTPRADRDAPDDVVYYHDIRRTIAVHVLAEAGRDVSAAIDDLYLARQLFPAFAKAFLAMAMHRADPDDERLGPLSKELANLVTEQAGSASVVETPSYDLGPVFHSDLRSSAIVMMALTRIARDHPVVPKLARGLMEKRYRGAWRNTQENAYALVAMSDYASHFEATTPAFNGQVWVDEAVLVDDHWRGRSSKERVGRLPMARARTLAGRSNGLIGLNVRRRGEGRAYYRLGMTYALTGRDVEAIARGITVRRTFRRSDGTETSEAPAKVRAGEIIAIDVELDVDTLVRHVAIDVPLPSGLEGINPALGSDRALPMHGARGWWLSHREYHDDRIVLFADVVQPGTHRHTIYVRATTPGDFAFPPTRAEAMYVPEVFGRTAGGATSVVR